MPLKLLLPEHARLVRLEFVLLIQTDGRVVVWDICSRHNCHVKILAATL